MLWSVLVYSPVAHWVFSPEGWAFKRGALDFAGGTVVHINAGAAGAGDGHPARPPARLAEGAHAPAQRAVRDARRGTAVVRLVRLQRRLRARRQPARRLRVPQHQHRHLRGGAGLDRRGEAALRQGDRGRRRVRRGRRPGRDHPVRGLRQPARLDRGRPDRRRRVRAGGVAEEPAPLRRLARRRRRAPRRRHPRLAVRRPVRDHRRQLARRRRPLLRRGRDAARQAGAGGAGGHRVLLRGHPGHRPPGQPGDQEPGAGPRWRTRASTSPCTARRPTSSSSVGGGSAGRTLRVAATGTGSTTTSRRCRREARHRRSSSPSSSTT